MMDCEQVRRRLWPLDRPRPLAEGEEAAREHLDACAACRAFFERDRLIGRALAELPVMAPAPPEVRERVFDALARERALVGSAADEAPPARATSKPALRRIIPWAVAAAAAVIIGTAVFRSAPPASDAAFAQDFLSREVEADVVEGPDATQVSAFFMREMGVPIPPVDLEEASLERAMICLIDGRRAAMVEYALEGYKLAHYRVPVDGRAREGRKAGPRARMTEENGVCVVRWSDGRYDHALVSNLPESRMREVATQRFAVELR